MLIVGLALTFFAGPAAGEQPIGAQREHPYLYFDAQGLAKLRQRFREGPLRAYRQALIQAADAFLDQDPKKQGPRDHDISSGAVQSLLWAYHLTGQDKYRDTTIAYIQARWDKTEFKQWSEMGTAAVATAYDTLYHELTDEQREKMKAYLERALDQHIRNADGWLYNNPSNTVPAQCGAAGMAALALLWESPKAAEAMQMTTAKLKTYAGRCFSPDGGYTEGTLYWAFGGSFYLAYAHALQNTTGDDSLLNHRLLNKQHRFVQTILGGDGQMMPFNDTQPSFYGNVLCADLGVRFDNDLMLWLADHMTAIKAGGENPHDIHVSAREVYLALAAIFRGDKPGPTEFPGVPTLSRLETMNWGVMRSNGDTLIPDLVVGVKGSMGALSHHKQYDLGSFIVYAYGEMLLIDPGYFQASARSHTLPLIDGDGPKRHVGSRIVQAWEAGDWRGMVIESGPAYKIAQRVRRTVVMHGNSAVVVLDDILPGEKPADTAEAWTGLGPPAAPADATPIRRATAQYQAAQKVTVDTQTGTATVKGKRTDLVIRTFGPPIQLTSRPRDFGKSWLYRSMDRAGKVAWHSVTGDYTIDANDPLVTVLQPARGDKPPAAPRVKRDGKTIRITLPGDKTVAFAWNNDRWEHQRPTGNGPAAQN